MNEPIAVIPKNSIDEIRVAWSEYKGHRYLDVRIYTEIEGRAEKTPTKRGITLRPDLLPELLTALHKAEAEAKAAGLLAEGHDAWGKLRRFHGEPVGVTYALQWMHRLVLR